MTAGVIDRKVGYSSMCQRGDHGFCKTAQARCTCTCHGKQGQQPPKPKERAVALASVPEVKGVVLGLVAETPPASQPGRKGVVSKIVALTADMKPGEWYRVASWPGKSSANSAKTQLVKKGHTDIEWVARTFEGGSALWARKS